MAYEIVPSVWKRFTSIFVQDVHQNVKLAAGISHDINKFADKFKAILVVLNDAQAKEMKERAVRDWLNKVKDIAYDMDDVLDEYNSTFLILQNEKVEEALNTKMKVCFIFYFPHLFFRIVALCRQISLKIKEINKRLDAVFKDEVMNNLNRGIEGFELKLEEFRGIPSYLFSSYNSLPSEVKQCLLYCAAIFPKGCVINKDQLIRLWMAQGYLNIGHNKEMEIVGQEYLTNIKTSFFQEFEKDNVISYKMEDEVYDFLQQLSHWGLKERILGSFHEEVCHLSLIIMLENGVTSPAFEFVYDIKRLRSLFIGTTAEYLNDSLTSNVLPNLLGKFTSLRALVFTTKQSSVGKILEDIGKSIHLRYLKFSELNIRNLPEILCELYNLQTLDLGGCEKIETLPQEIRKLVNLRYLNLCRLNLRYLPQTFGELRNLRTLDLGGCRKLEELPETVCELHNLQFLDLEECEKLEELPRWMEKLTNLSNLNLHKSKLISFPDILCNLDNLQVLDLAGCEGFEYLPEQIKRLTNLRYLNLEILKISHYKGETFPSNLMRSLINLRELLLWHCANYKHLPPLGKLPSLESLSVWYMNRVKSVGNEFLGIEGDEASSPIILFPKLKSLRFWRLDECEEWNYGITSKRGGKDHVTIMPCLALLSVGWCFKLKALPDLLLQSTKLEELEISSCHILEERYKEGGEDWPKISHISNIMIGFKYVKGGPR